MSVSTREPGRPERSSGTRHRRWLLPLVLLLVWFTAAVPLGIVSGKLAGVQQNDDTASLPDSAESTRVNDLERRFSTETSIPVIIVWEAPGKVDGATTQAVDARLAEVRRVAKASGKLAGDVSPALPSEDGRALEAVVPLRADVGDGIVDIVKELRGVVTVPGATAYVTGPGGVFADFANGFEGIDGLLLLAAFGVVLLLLLVVYRSPILPFAVIITAGLAYTGGQAVAYGLVRAGWITVNGQSQGIAGILVIGAATDYGLLLTSRFREELRRQASKYDAMRTALRRSLEPIVASGATVILGVLCLLASDLAGNRALGPISAVNVVLAVVAALTFLPAVLVLLGRAAFWPIRPTYDPGAATMSATVSGKPGLWDRTAGLVRRRSVAVLGASVLLLAVLAAFSPTFKASGISIAEGIRGGSQAVDGQAVLARHFDAGAGSPAVIITPEANWRAVAATAGKVEGVSVVTPLGEAGQQAGGPPPGAGGKPAGAPGQPGQQPGDTAPKVVDGLVQLDATLTDAEDSDAALDTIRNLRPAVHQVDGAALVGGRTAQQLDLLDTGERDRAVIIPLVLVVVTVVLALLLRALVAPLLLLATVVLSFAATIGLSALVFDHVFGFPGSDPNVSLYAFVFLVALGIDYNIFLMTRAREESARHGTRQGILTALAVTGGVITSAGLVLAATFGALAVLPILVLTQIAFIVAAGVLLDTFLVRSLVVPAAVYLLGDRTWWPSRLGRDRHGAGEPAGEDRSGDRVAAHRT